MWRKVIFPRKATGNYPGINTFDIVIEQFIDWCDDSDNSIHLYTWGAKDYQFLIADCNAHKIEMDWMNEYIDLKSGFDFDQQFIGVGGWFGNFFELKHIG